MGTFLRYLVIIYLLAINYDLDDGDNLKLQLSERFRYILDVIDDDDSKGDENAATDAEIGQADEER